MVRPWLLPDDQLALVADGRAMRPVGQLAYGIVHASGQRARETASPEPHDATAGSRDSRTNRIGRLLT